MKLRYTEQAVANLDSIGEFVHARSPRAASRIRAAINIAADTLTDFPGMGRMLSVKDVRKVAVRRFPYVIYYRADLIADEIIVLMIQHIAQDRPFSVA